MGIRILGDQRLPRILIPISFHRAHPQTRPHYRERCPLCVSVSLWSIYSGRQRLGMAIDRQRLTRDFRTGVGADEQHHVGDVLRLDEGAH